VAAQQDVDDLRIANSRRVDLRHPRRDGVATRDGVRHTSRLECGGGGAQQSIAHAFHGLHHPVDERRLIVRNRGHARIIPDRIFLVYDRRRMNHVAIVGSGGAGKSTFARELGRLTGLPVYHLDCYMWKPGWVMTPDAEGDAIATE